MGSLSHRTKQQLVPLTISVLFGVVFAGAIAQASTIGTNFTADGTLTVNGTTGTTTIAAGQGFAVGGSQFLVQQGSGFVGIGTTTPDSGLTVNGTTHITNAIVINFSSDSGAPVWQISDLGTGSSAEEGFLIKDITAGEFNGFIPFEAESTQTNQDQYRIFFNRYGPTATTTGSIAFHFSDTAPGQRNDLADFAIGSESGAAGKVGIKIHGAPSQTGDLQEWTDNSSNVLAEVTANGSIGIGTTSPVANFQVANGAATTTMEIGKSGQSKGTCLKLYRTDGSAIYAYVAAGQTTFTLATTACASVTSF